MSAEEITVLGGGNTAFSVAANLTLSGASVALCELPKFSQQLKPVQAWSRIDLDGAAGRGAAFLRLVTTDFAAGLAGSELVLLTVPAYGHRAFAEACAPHLQKGQTVVLMPGTLGSLEFVRVLREQGAADGVIVGETDTAPYVCRKTSAMTTHIWGVVKAMGLGVIPRGEGERVLRLVERWFPGTRLYPSVLTCGLAAMNPVVHPAGVLLNAGRIERSRGDFYFYDEGVTPGVCRLIHAVDRERLAIAEALDIELPPVEQAFHEAGFGPRGDIWATINGSRILTQLRAPGALDTRWLSEDVPYGIAAWAQLGEQLGVDCHMMRTLVDMASATLGRDLWKAARTPQHLGIAGLSKKALLDHAAGGSASTPPLAETLDAHDQQ